MFSLKLVNKSKAWLGPLPSTWLVSAVSAMSGSKGENKRNESLAVQLIIEIDLNHH